MSTLIVKVCEECGQRSAGAEGWLSVGQIDIRCARSGGPLLRQSDVDLCSRGCLLRYIADRLSAANCRVDKHEAEQVQAREEDEPVAHM